MLHLTNLKISKFDRILKFIESHKIHYTNELNLSNPFIPFQLIDNNLIIKKVLRKHHGTIKCQVSGANQQKNAITLLNVYFGPDRIESPYEEMYAYIGHPITLSCSIIGYPLILNWTFNNAYSESNYSISTNNSDITINIYDKIQHEGIYICHGANQINEFVEHKIRLKSIEPKSPSITKPFNEQLSVNIGDDLHFNCECNFCGPIQESHWYRNNDKLSENWYEMKKTIDNLTLNLSLVNIRKQDEGIYSCLMKNDFGVNKIDIKVIVMEDELKTSSTIDCNLNSTTFSIKKWTNDNEHRFLSLISNNTLTDSDVFIANANFYNCQTTSNQSFPLLIAGKFYIKILLY